ncbi:hypothetical protein ACF0H5_017841 [Mactra antiquata]
MFRLLVICTVLFLSENVYSLSTQDITMQEMFQVFKDMIDASDVANEAKMARMEVEFIRRQEASELEISALKSKIEIMETDFKLKVLAMEEEINTLKASVEANTGGSSSRQKEENNVGDAQKHQKRHILSSGIQRERNIRKGRAYPETEVAFYATHATNRIHHLGSNQILPFQTSFTNVGNAFNNNTGAFVAPVDGTYVFHATILAIDIPTDNGHFRAHFDVNGTTYSVFYVTSYDQSSQMFVINLKSGDTVSIRNDSTDYGFYGEQHSTFSGFLLYEHNTEGVIIGK